MPVKPKTDTEALIAALTARLDRLEAGAGAKAAATPAEATNLPGLDAEKYWLLTRVGQGAETRTKRGEVVYGGIATVPTGEQFLWQRHASVQQQFKSDWTLFVDVIAALGHPVRLTLLKLILEGKTSKAELETNGGLGTSGQLYHHLKTLQEAGWVRSLERGHYHVPGERVVPLLAILAAAAG